MTGIGGAEQHDRQTASQKIKHEPEEERPFLKPVGQRKYIPLRRLIITSARLREQASALTTSGPYGTLARGLTAPESVGRRCEHWPALGRGYCPAGVVGCPGWP